MMHRPVLLNEVLKLLQPKKGDNFIDCTLGFGGHAAAFLQKGARVLGIEADKDIYNCIAGESGFLKVNDSYINLEKIVVEKNWQNIKAVLFDLGVSMWHFKRSGRGFSFQKEEPLDMRFVKTGLSARDIVNNYSQEEIKDILTKYGQERFSGRIAKAIVESRGLKPIETTFALTGIIEKSVPGRSKINKATKTFQALRIAANNELENIKRGVASGFNVLAKGGRVAVISFHSLEDKIIKDFFKEKDGDKQAVILTKKPITASWQEIKTNPASRSAKLRVMEKV